MPEPRLLSAWRARSVLRPSPISSTSNTAQRDALDSSQAHATPESLREAHVADATTHQQRSSSVNVAPMERWLSMVAGGMLAAWGLQRRGSTGGSAALGAAALLYRG